MTEGTGSCQSETCPSTSTGTEPEYHRTPCLIVLGMAGCGKTTFVQRLVSHLHTRRKVPYVVNLDPAVYDLPYPTNIDIRDTVNYKEVMKQYGLGPNGGIMTSLNLFTTRCDQMVGFVRNRAPQSDYIVLDTPGQIEVFTWSASGAIISEALASLFPTLIVYLMDCSRMTNPGTFMSNMLYACSIMYRSRLPMIIVFNKNDIVDHRIGLEWMRDFDSFQQAIAAESSYSHNLYRSMSLCLEEFYCNLSAVGVSSLTGYGMDEFCDAVSQAVDDYEQNYRQEYIKQLGVRQQQQSMTEIQDQLERIRVDPGLGESLNIHCAPASTVHTSDELPRAGSDADDDDDDDDGGGLEKDEVQDQDEVKEYDSFQRFLRNSVQR